MMLRIAEALARRDRALALVTGDSLGQVASQTLRNMVAVEAAASMPVFRPLVGTDKMEIMATARKIGTYDTSSEPFHDCCPCSCPAAGAFFDAGAIGGSRNETGCAGAGTGRCARRDSRRSRLFRGASGSERADAGGSRGEAADGHRVTNFRSARTARGLAED